MVEQLQGLLLEIILVMLPGPNSVNSNMSIMQTDVWAVREATRCALSLNFSGIIVEVDNTQVI